MSTKGGPVFTFSLPGGRLALLPPPSVKPLSAHKGAWASQRFFPGGQ